MYRHKPLQKSIPKAFGINMQLVLVPQGHWRGGRFALSLFNWYNFNVSLKRILKYNWD